MSGSIWIDIDFKDYYSDSSKKGLRLRFYEGVNPMLKQEVKDFIKWLRKLYWFPIMCNIIFVHQESLWSENKQTKCSAIYSHPNEGKKELPNIYISCKDRINQYGMTFIITIYFCIVHELTHYYQWYFLENSNRSARSLEIEANKWARYLAYEYLVTNRQDARKMK